MKEAEPEPAWHGPLLQAARLLFTRSLESLRPEERMVVARVHILLYANARKSENANKSKARGPAAQIALLCGHRDYGSMTVGDYFRAAKKCWIAGAKSPLWTPSDVRSMIEFERNAS